MSTKRVLYIEDNAMNMRLVRRLLTANGYTVIEASDGLKGIAVAARERPELILMDINLPGIDGMEATSRLKSSYDLAHIPIVALTAVAMKGDRERILAAGCDDYLQKPIDNALLIETVRRFIGEGEPKTAGTVKETTATPSPVSAPEPPRFVFTRRPTTSNVDKVIEQRMMPPAALNHPPSDEQHERPSVPMPLPHAVISCEKSPVDTNNSQNGE